MGLWRSGIVATIGIVGSLLDRNDTFRTSKLETISKETPEDIIAPFGVFLILSEVIFAITAGMLEFGIVSAIEKIYKVQLDKKKFLTERTLTKFNKIIDINNINKAKKYRMVCKDPISDKEKFIYYKYAVKAFIFRKKEFNDDEQAILDELIRLRDETYQHYLILHIAKVK